MKCLVYFPIDEAAGQENLSPVGAFTALESRIITCHKCPRLIRHCKAVAERKKREFLSSNYWGKPVPGFGDTHACLWIIGLAPAAHGANRTGRMFTGDSSGRWLYRALHATGFSPREESISSTDGLQLNDVYISATLRCAPPDNKPLPSEIENCREFLDEEFLRLTNVKVLLVTGAIAFHAALRLLKRRGWILPRPLPRFVHGAMYSLGRITLLASYHPSRQNTQTGRLTEAMWLRVFKSARELLASELISQTDLF